MQRRTEKYRAALDSVANLGHRQDELNRKEDALLSQIGQLHDDWSRAKDAGKLASALERRLHQAMDRARGIRQRLARLHQAREKRLAAAQAYKERKLELSLKKWAALPKNVQERVRAEYVGY